VGRQWQTYRDRPPGRMDVNAGQSNEVSHIPPLFSRVFCPCSNCMAAAQAEPHRLSPLLPPSPSPTYLVLSLIFCPYNADGRIEGLSAPPARCMLPMSRRRCLPPSLQCRLPKHPTSPDPTRSAGSMHCVALASAHHVEDPAREMACRHGLSYPDADAQRKTTRPGLHLHVKSLPYSFAYTGSVHVTWIFTF
jgi:hypothetical protein